MPHSLQLVARDRGYGRDPLPVAEDATEIVHRTIDLPGFSYGGVTYQSHHFWIHFLRYKRNPEGDRLRGGVADDLEKFTGVVIRVRHGGGWEIWRSDSMLANALANLSGDPRAMFWLCWSLIDIADSAKQAGVMEATTEYRRAFMDGRLKKRKLPSRDYYKVWIEEPAITAPQLG